VQQQAAILSYLDMFRLFGVLTLLVIPLMIFMRRPGHGGELVAAH
jgi:hypothetical protein